MVGGSRWRPAVVTAVVLLSSTAQAATEACALRSPSHRVTVLELYTSEGCNSCPPADRWLSGLSQHGISPQTAVLLAFHVDYWNRLGWPDRFSQPAFSERQRAVTSRNHLGAIYTPQIVLDGRDFRWICRPDKLFERLRKINLEAGHAKIDAERDAPSGGKSTSMVTSSSVAQELQEQAETWIAVFENGLSSRVTAGENAGRLLYHDFVVRELYGPFKATADLHTRLDQRIRLDVDWHTERRRCGSLRPTQRYR